MSSCIQVVFNVDWCWPSSLSIIDCHAHGICLIFKVSRDYTKCDVEIIFFKIKVYVLVYIKLGEGVKLAICLSQSEIILLL